MTLSMTQRVRFFGAGRGDAVHRDRGQLRGRAYCKVYILLDSNYG